MKLHSVAYIAAAGLIVTQFDQAQALDTHIKSFANGTPQFEEEW